MRAESERLAEQLARSVSAAVALDQALAESRALRLSLDSVLSTRAAEPFAGPDSDTDAHAAAFPHGGA